MAAKTANKPPTLLESVMTMPKRKRTRNWVDKLPDVEMRRQIRDLLVARFEGRIEHSSNELARRICERFGPVCNRQSVDHWINLYEFNRSVADVG